MAMTNLERDLRFLKAYAVGVTLVILSLAVVGIQRAGAAQERRARFTEIDVERINLMESADRYRMVISNRAKSQGPLYQGKPFLYTGAQSPRSGMIFFNDEGTETGGLIFGGRQLNDTSFSGLGHLSFDQFNQNQVFVIQYVDRNGKRRMGVQINDRHDRNIYEWANTRDSVRRLPDGPAKTEALRRLETGEPGEPRVAERVYVGRDTLKGAVVNLSDRNGRTRLRLVVDSVGSARIEFLAADGRIIHRVDGTGGLR